MILMRSRERKQDLLFRKASFGALPRLFKKSAVTQQLAELLGPILSVHPSREFSQAHAFAARQHHTPSMGRGLPQCKALGTRLPERGQPCGSAPGGIPFPFRRGACPKVIDDLLSGPWR
jgi:hypothetical protein